MKKKIQANMGAVSVEGDSAAAEFVFPASFEGFRGHFPDNPILPGVCLVQCALVLAEQVAGRNLRLQTLPNAKFLSPVAPGQPVRVECSLRGAELRASIASGDQRIATLTLEVADA